MTLFIPDITSNSRRFYPVFLSNPSHEFEEVLGETETVYNIGVVEASSSDVEEHEEEEHEEEEHEEEEHEEEEHEEEEEEETYNGWSEKKLPMAIFKPFGYSAGPTQLMTAAFWIWLVFGILLHIWKYISSKKIQDAEESANAEKIGVKALEHEETSNMDDNDQPKEDVSTDGDNSYDEFVKIVEGNQSANKC